MCAVFKDWHYRIIFVYFVHIICITVYLYTLSALHCLCNQEKTGSLIEPNQCVAILYMHLYILLCIFVYICRCICIYVCIYICIYILYIYVSGQEKTGSLIEQNQCVLQPVFTDWNLKMPQLLVCKQDRDLPPLNRKNHQAFKENSNQVALFGKLLSDYSTELQKS